VWKIAPTYSTAKFESQTVDSSACNKVFVTTYRPDQQTSTYFININETDSNPEQGEGDYKAKRTKLAVQKAMKELVPPNPPVKLTMPNIGSQWQLVMVEMLE